MREAHINRKTRETAIELELNLDQLKPVEIDTTIGFFNHMLESFSMHAGISLKIKATGDTDIDNHHTVEDVGICLGDAFRQALANGKPVCRYGHFTLPMDETLVQSAIDFSNRPVLVYNTPITTDNRIGNFELELIKEFFRAFVNHAGATLHINVLYGENLHHIAEGIFKSFAHAVMMAIVERNDKDDILSTKGSF